MLASCLVSSERNNSADLPGPNHYVAEVFLLETRLSICNIIPVLSAENMLYPPTCEIYVNIIGKHAKPQVDIQAR